MRKFTPDHLSIQVLRKLNLATWRGKLRETCIKKIRVRAEQPQSVTRESGGTQGKGPVSERATGKGRAGDFWSAFQHLLPTPALPSPELSISIPSLALVRTCDQG